MHREGKILKEDYEDNDVLHTPVMPHAMRHQFAPFEETANAGA